MMTVGHLYWDAWKGKSGLCSHARSIEVPPMQGRFFGAVYAGPGRLCLRCEQAVSDIAVALAQAREEAERLANQAGREPVRGSGAQSQEVP